MDELVPVRGYQPLRNADLGLNLRFAGVVELSA
jgi:hypothetical protein